MDQADYRRIIQLEARMKRMEAMMQTVLMRLDINPAEFMSQDPPEVIAIYETLLSGNKILAIKLYREFYGTGLKEAKEAIDAMERSLR